MYLSICFTFIYHISADMNRYADTYDDSDADAAAYGGDEL